MNLIENIRSKNKHSQRSLAQKSRVSFRALQLIEWGGDTRVSTLNKIAEGLGYTHNLFKKYVYSFFESPPDSIFHLSRYLTEHRSADWKIPLFNFVDSFRKTKDLNLILLPLAPDLSDKLTAILASTVESLCHELGMDLPSWCEAVEPLNNPWFPSEMENLKAIALVESPVYFRKRNIFVLKNFLERV